MTPFDRNRLDTLIEPLWVRIDSGTETPADMDPGLFTSWNYQLTPPFPDQWPVASSTVFTQYAYARGLALAQMIDGVYVAAPWAAIHHRPDRDAEPEIVMLSEELHEVGVQGVQPLSESEINSYGLEEAASTLLHRLREGGEASEDDRAILKDFYRTWLSCNGVIAEGIRLLHKEFFLWIK